MTEPPDQTSVAPDAEQEPGATETTAQPGHYTSRGEQAENAAFEREGSYSAGEFAGGPDS